MKYIQIIKATFPISSRCPRDLLRFYWLEDPHMTGSSSKKTTRTTESLCHTIIKVLCATLKLAALSVKVEIYFITTIPCFQFLPLRSWMAGVPWSIHFPPPLFPNWFGSQWLPEPGAAPGLSWHHVITSHDMSSSFTPTLITITIPVWPMLTPAVWTFKRA